MFNRFIRYGLLLTALLFFAVACSSTQATAPAATGAPVLTSAPATTAPTTAPAAQSVTAAASPTSAPGSTAARTLNDVDSSKVYTFQIVPDQTQASYSVQEVLLGQSLTTTGTTNTVQGQFQLGVKDGKPYIELSQLRVDLRTLTSDNRLRDEAIRRQWLESNTYPYADFVAKEVTGFPSDPVEGQDVHFKVTGDMTIRNITRSVTFDITAKVEGDMLTGTATTLIYMKDYGFSAPEIAGRFTVADGVTVTVKGVAKLAQS
jgi:polyisoprenoid-binding protein YceI